MSAHLKKFAFLALAALGLASPVSAAPFASPEGVWELEFRDSRFQVTHCGPNGLSLCGELIWLSESASTPDKTRYLNTMMINQARRSGENSWKGNLNIFGQSAAGNIRQVSDDVIDLEGCTLLVLCRTYKLYRVE